MKKIMLVYQAGIANVFQVDCFNLSSYGRNAKRLMQGTFGQCEMFARGAGICAKVATAWCNQSGDIVDAYWESDNKEQPFTDEQKPVFIGVQWSIPPRATGA